MRESNNLQKGLVVVFIGMFLYITGVTNVLGGFWRTFNNINDNDVETPNLFLLGYGHGDDGWGDGYGYGYGNNYGYGYYVSPECGTADDIEYSRNATSWGSYTFCTHGYVAPSNPVFPTNGSFTTWSCKSGEESVSCKARRQSNSSGGGGGGGSRVRKTDWCPDGDYTSSIYDGQCGDAPDDDSDDDGDDDDSNRKNKGKATTDYKDGICKFNDAVSIDLLGVPAAYKAEMSYHSSRCTIKGLTRDGKHYLMPYSDILLVETMKVVARLNPEWFDDVSDFNEDDYDPWYKGYQDILDEKGVLDGVSVNNLDKKLNYYDFMLILLNRLEVEEIIDADKNAEVIEGLPNSWKTKYTQRVKMLKILAFIDHNIKRY